MVKFLKVKVKNSSFLVLFKLRSDKNRTVARDVLIQSRSPEKYFECRRSYL